MSTQFDQDVDGRHAIFFDGALPPSKREERLQRLRDHRNALDARRKRSLSGLDMIRESGSQALPPPFLVPAVVEALTNSETISSKVYVVPGEADTFCATAARSVSCDEAQSITVFSDDSDLVVYPAMAKTRVVPFRDISIFRTLDETVWTGSEIWPQRLAGRFGDPELGLLKPAFLMSLKHTLTLERAHAGVTAADPGTCKTTAGAYESFARTFALEDATKAWTRMQHDAAVDRSRPILDTRILELVQSMKTAEQFSTTPTYEIFLPLLLDDPSRKSAWAVADEIRRLAYSVAFNNTGMDARLQEFRRSGAENKIAAIDVELLADRDIAAQLAQQLEAFESAFRNGSEVLDPRDQWRLACARHLLDVCKAQSSTLPKINEIMLVLRGQQTKHSWDALHLSAQYQATYYSFRMLKQLMSYAHTHANPDQPKSWRDMQDRLNSLPTIPAFFESASNRSLVELEAAVSKICASYDGAKETLRPPRAIAEKVLRAKGKESRAPAIKHASKNPFALLSDA